MSEENYVIIRSLRDHKTLELLKADKQFIHVNGPLPIWLIQLIIKCCPSVKKIRLIPAQLKRIKQSGETVQRLCKEHRIELVAGVLYEKLQWKKKQSRNKTYEIDKEFFQDLKGEQAKLWQELLLFGFLETILAERYYCMRREQLITCCELGGLYDLNENQARDFIKGVMVYLDPNANFNKHAKQIAKSIREKIPALRKVYQNGLEIMDRLRELWINKLPANLTLASPKDIEMIVKISNISPIAWHDFRNKYPRFFRFIVLRYGLEGNKIMSIEEVGRRFQISRHLAAKREQEVLRFLKLI